MNPQFHLQKLLNKSIASFIYKNQKKFKYPLDKKNILHIDLNQPNTTAKSQHGGSPSTKIPSKLTATIYIKPFNDYPRIVLNINYKRTQFKKNQEYHTVLAKYTSQSSIPPLTPNSPSKSIINLFRNNNINKHSLGTLTSHFIQTLELAQASNTLKTDFKYYYSMQSLINDMHNKLSNFSSDLENTYDHDNSEYLFSNRDDLANNLKNIETNMQTLYKRLRNPNDPHITLLFNHFYLWIERLDILDNVMNTSYYYLYPEEKDDDDYSYNSPQQQSPQQSPEDNAWKDELRKHEYFKVVIEAAESLTKTLYTLKQEICPQHNPDCITETAKQEEVYKHIADISKQIQIMRSFNSYIPLIRLFANKLYEDPHPMFLTFYLKKGLAHIALQFYMTQSSIAIFEFEVTYEGNKQWTSNLLNTFACEIPPISKTKDEDTYTYNFIASFIDTIRKYQTAYRNKTRKFVLHNINSFVMHYSPPTKTSTPAKSTFNKIIALLKTKYNDNQEFESQLVPIDPPIKTKKETPRTTTTTATATAYRRLPSPDLPVRQHSPPIIFS